MNKRLLCHEGHRSINNRKPLPPYGKELQEHLQRALQPKNNVFLFLGKDPWQSAKAFNASQVVLVLPPGKSPYEYYWPVKGCSILAIAKGELATSYVEQAAHALLIAGAMSVHVMLPNYRLIVYRGG
jgi:hypothetical protein